MQSEIYALRIGTKNKTQQYLTSVSVLKNYFLAPAKSFELARNVINF